MMERWECSVYMANKQVEYVSSGELQPLQFAYLGREPFMDPRRFGEIVATNRGVSVKATTDLREALEWLGVAGVDTMKEGQVG